MSRLLVEKGPNPHCPIALGRTRHTDWEYNSEFLPNQLPSSEPELRFTDSVTHGSDPQELAMREHERQQAVASSSKPAAAASNPKGQYRVCSSRWHPKCEEGRAWG